MALVALYRAWILCIIIWNFWSSIVDLNQRLSLLLENLLFELNVSHWSWYWRSRLVFSASNFVLQVSSDHFGFFESVIYFLIYWFHLLTKWFGFWCLVFSFDNGIWMLAPRLISLLCFLGALIVILGARGILGPVDTHWASQWNFLYTLKASEASEALLRH